MSKKRPAVSDDDSDGGLDIQDVSLESIEGLKRQMTETDRGVRFGQFIRKNVAEEVGELIAIRQKLEEEKNQLEEQLASISSQYTTSAQAATQLQQELARLKEDQRDKMTQKSELDKLRNAVNSALTEQIAKLKKLNVTIRGEAKEYAKLLKVDRKKAAYLAYFADLLKELKQENVIDENMISKVMAALSEKDVNVVDTQLRELDRLFMTSQTREERRQIVGFLDAI